MDIRKLTDDVSVSPQLKPGDMEKLAALGFKTVINNRPDDEAPMQPAAKRLKADAEKAGLKYFHQPVVSGNITQEDLDAFGRLLGTVDGPVLAFCRTGTRSAHLWAGSQSGHLGQAQITRIGKLAGYDI